MYGDGIGKRDNGSCEVSTREAGECGSSAGRPNAGGTRRVGVSHTPEQKQRDGIQEQNTLHSPCGKA